MLLFAGIVAYVALEYIPKTSNKEIITCTSCSDKVLKSGLKLTGNKGINRYKNHYNKTWSNSDNSPGFCTSASCKYIAENLKKSLNLCVDPCEDFHQYACGLWPKYHPLSPSMPKLDTMSLLNLEKDKYLKNLIENELSKEHREKGFKNKIIKFYKSCMDTDAMDARGAKPLLKFISKFGHWSPIKTWTEVGDIEKDITTLLVLSHQYFTSSVYDDRVKSPLFKSIVKVNDINSREHIFEVRCEYLSLLSHC